MSAPAALLRLELGRKGVHLALVVLPVWIHATEPPLRQGGLLVAFLAGLGIDVARLVWPAFRAWFQARWGAYLRADERHRITSAHWLTFAAWLVSLLAARDVATLAVAYAVVGDSAAAIAGRIAGRGQKSWVGSAACFATCVACGAIVLGGLGAATLAGAAAATLCERLGWPNDNLSVPLVSAAVLAALLH
jgi:dolichol kinase